MPLQGCVDVLVNSLPDSSACPCRQDTVGQDAFPDPELAAHQHPPKLPKSRPAFESFGPTDRGDNRKSARASLRGGRRSGEYAVLKLRHWKPPVRRPRMTLAAGGRPPANRPPTKGWLCMDRSLVQTSKFLSLVLRHRPDLIGLSLDEQGWAKIEELIDAARRSGRHLTRELLDRVVRENDKKRFALSEDRTKIRASQGHSIDVDLGLEPLQPPEMLYHGTVSRSLASIRETGLRCGSRRHVHLSRDTETAAGVGRRRGRPVVLQIRSGAMHREGFAFYLSANGVWLTDHVPADYIVFP